MSPLNVKSWHRLLESPTTQEHLVKEILPDYLRQQRWFGAKSSLIKKYELEKHLTYEFGEQVVHMALIEVTFQTSNSDTYLVPLGFQAEDEAATEGRICEINAGRRKGWIVDAFQIAEFREDLFRKIRKKARVSVENGFLEMDRGKAMTWRTGDPLESKLLNLEQSNTTLVFNDKYYLKIYRKLYRDLNPDFEVSRFLSEKTDFDNTPAYCGSITWSKPGFYKVTVGLMQEKVENQGDIWPFYLERVSRYFTRMEAVGLEAEKLDKVPLYKPKAAEELPEHYATLIGEDTLKSVQKLAQRTCEMHLALFRERSETAFNPISYSEDYKVWLLNRILYLLDHRITTMESVMDTFSPKAKAFAEEFLARKVEVKNLILTFDESMLSSSRIRIHGDYHLGQVLRSVEDNDLFILDFEGEPEATIRDRKVKHSPLKDVAGMMRSFHYAVFATIFSENDFKQGEAELVEAGGRWYRAIVAVFLNTYLTTAFDNGLNIGYYKEIDFLLRYHIFEKAIYELGYELNSRPDWVIIPLKGLNQILNND